MAHPMDSQLTLVDIHGPTPLGENIVLIFDRDDVCNTTLRVPGDYLPSYSVDTHDYTTTIRAGNVLLATVTRNRFRRDQITFPGSRPMNLGNWLKAPVLSTLPLVFHACGRRCEWRRDSSGQLLLHESSGGRPDEIVASFSRSRLGGEDAARLAIKPEMAEVRDMIVLSCLLVEHKLRVIDLLTAVQSKAAIYSVIF